MNAPQIKDPASGNIDLLVAEVVAEITDRLHAGERVDVEAYTTRHPEMAERLRQLLPALQVLVQFSSSASPGKAGGDGTEICGTLGDFRILREVGRGGMGIVYEAEQISLSRRVALKVLPFAATMDSRHLQRFHNEARAAASLEHPHIVPVYGVGCERGVHYYAMKFIEGQSLASLIQGRPGVSDHPLSMASPTSPADPTALAAAPTERAPRDAAAFRQIAAWGIQAAEALEYAHSLGIVHRDIKPANLMVDGDGKLWVTDFGLARTVTDAGLTMSGDLLGTLRYMSPEQALAKHGLVDHRTDIYSLGATLYELLTDRPAVEGQDRHEILKRIVEDEPPLLRTPCREVPPELETIVLKSMARDPVDRYGTSKELADDLHRFLDNKPICATRPSFLQRLRKWGQRHRQLVRLTALFLVLVVVGLAVGTFLLWREQEQTRLALEKARANHAEAQVQRQRAETNFREAFWTIEHLLAAYDPGRTSGPQDFAKLKQYQTNEALRFLTAFCEQQSDDPAVRLQQGAAFVHTARVYQIRQEQHKIQQAYQKAIAVFDRLVEEFPDNPAYPNELALALTYLADHVRNAGQIQDATAHYARALAVWREAVRKHPADFVCLYHLANVLCNSSYPKLYDPRGAVELAQKAATLAPHLARNWLALGRANYRSGEWHAALAALQKVPRDKTAGNWTKAQIACFLAMSQWRCGKHAEARVSYDQAVRLMETDFDARQPGLLAEAADLLGIQEPLIPKNPQGALRKD